MIVQCEQCKMYYDDQFRTIVCPHDTFLANDGQNNFAHYSESWLKDREPDKGKILLPGAKSEHKEYQEWLELTRIKF